MSMTATVTPRIASASLDQVLSSLRALHVDIHHVTYGPGHRFECCEWCDELDTEANCTVYSYEAGSHDVGMCCVVKAAEDAAEDSNGRPNLCTVEIGTVEAPSPSVVLIPAPREHDLAPLGVIACDVCPEARRSVARFQLAFDVIRHGEPEPVRWLICPSCLDSCMFAAEKQHAGFTPVELTRLPVTTREQVAA